MSPRAADLLIRDEARRIRRQHRQAAGTADAASATVGLARSGLFKPDLPSVAPLILPEVSPPFARPFLGVPVALFWLWVRPLDFGIIQFLINLDFWRAARTNHPIDHHTTIARTPAAPVAEAVRSFGGG
jgi:hypothetical protein